MSTRSMLHQASLNEWSKRLADQKSSGLSVMEWCKLNNLSKYQYFYWKRQLKEEAFEQVLPEIVPLAMHLLLPRRRLFPPLLKLLGKIAQVAQLLHQTQPQESL